MCLQDIARNAAERLLAQMAPEERVLLPSASLLVSEALAEHAALPVAPSDPEDYFTRWMRLRAFAERFDALRPLTSPWVVARATEVARTRVRTLARFAPRGALSPSDDSGYAAFGLVELGKAMTRGVEPVDPFLYLGGIIRNLILDDLERHGIAAAHEVPEPAPPAGERDELDVVFDALLVAALDRAVTLPPFNDADRDTWALLKAADFQGHRIDWSKSLRPPPTAHAGAQRLYMLRVKLVAVMDDWR